MPLHPARIYVTLEFGVLGIHGQAEEGTTATMTLFGWYIGCTHLEREDRYFGPRSLWCDGPIYSVGLWLFHILDVVMTNDDIRAMTPEQLEEFWCASV